MPSKAMRSSCVATRIRLTTACLAACIVAGLMLGSQCAPPPGNGVNTGSGDLVGTGSQVTIHTNLGKIVVELFPGQAPLSVANFIKYADENYYDGKIVHESNSNRTTLFLGSFSVDLEEGADKPLVNESNNGLKNTRGRVALYGPSDQPEGQPQFVINMGTNTSLDFVLANGNKVPFTVIGRVLTGMDIVDKIGSLPIDSGTSTSGIRLSRIPINEDGFPVRIIKMSSQDGDAPDNQSPIADAGENQAVAPSSTVTLKGTATDPDGDPMIYKWELTEESQQALEDANLAVPTLANDMLLETTFTAPKPTTPIDLVCRLTVTDDRGAESTDTVTITVNDNTNPVALAGPDHTTQPGLPVQLDGSGSTDVETDADDLTFSWAQISGPAVALNNPAISRPTFTAPVVAEPTVLTFELTVTDAKGAQGTDTAHARILPIVFDPVVSYPAGIGSTLTGIVTANFNTGGKPDVAVADSANNRILVLMNDENGGLGAATAYAIGGSPSCIVSGDFDNDGDQDIAASTTGNNKLYILLNDGSGVFTVEAETYNLGPNPASLIATDIDGKNGPDVVSVNLDDNKLSVRLNDGDGAFNAGRTDLSASVPDSGAPIATTGARVAAAGKIDADSRMDLLVVYETTDNAAPFLGQGDGSFKFPGAFDVVSADPKAVFLSDLNADSRPDSVIALNDVDKIAVRMNSSTGTFGLEARYDTGVGPSALAVADIDGDRKPDVIVANNTDNSVSILQNKSTGALRAKIDVALATGDTGPVGVAAVDINGDGAVDIVTANATSGTVTVLLSRTSPSFASVDANGFTTTSTWLKYKDIEIGAGDLVASDATVVARYTGRLNDENGIIFDTTVGTADETAGREFSLNSVIKGWKEGLGGFDMRVGGKRQLLIPPDLGYGAPGSGAKIPPYALLWFEVEILEVK